MFITEEARIQLEKAGAILYKDASANKGGVTSSSLEVITNTNTNTESPSTSNHRHYYHHHHHSTLMDGRQHYPHQRHCHQHHHHRHHHHNTNNCTLITMSQVLVALALTDEEHMKYMQVHDIDHPPQFYSDYVKEVQEIIRHNAYLELYVKLILPL